MLERFREICETKDGWYPDARHPVSYGKAILEEHKGWLFSTLINYCIDNNLDGPFMYITIEGGIIAEWDHGPIVSVEFDPYTKTIDPLTREEYER